MMQQAALEPLVVTDAVDGWTASIAIDVAETNVAETNVAETHDVETHHCEVEDADRFLEELDEFLYAVGEEAGV